MSYPKVLLRLRPTKGIVSDVPSHEVSDDFYTTGQNVIFREGFAGRVKGTLSVYTAAIADIGIPPTDILHIINANVSDTNYWLIFDPNKAWSLEGANQVQRDNSLLTTTITQPWHYSSALLNGLPIITNGADEPVYWAGDNLIELTDWTSTESCKSIATFKFHIFALDIDGPGGTFKNLVKWSHAAEPGTIPNSWTPAADNEAGSVELSYGSGPVLQAVPLRDSLLIYKHTTVYSVHYVGGNSVFAFQNIASSSGALNRHAVADVGDGQHLVVEQGDIVLFDGTNRKSVGQSRMKDFLFNQIDEDNFENLFVTFNRAKNEVIIAFPMNASTRCNLALIYDIPNDAFGVRDLPDIATAVVGRVDDTEVSDAWDDDSGVWDDDQSTWNSAGLGVVTESVVFAYDGILENQDTDDNVSMAASIGKYDLTFGEPERVKFIKRLHVRAKTGFGTLLVRVGSRMTPTESIVWSDEVTLTEPEQIVNTFAQGRYISVEMRTTGDSVWTMTGVDIEAEMRGYH